MYIERPGSPSATTVAPASKRRSTSIETRISRLASERPPKKGVASRNAFRSGELTVIPEIYSRPQALQNERARAGLPLGLRYLDGWPSGHLVLLQVLRGVGRLAV